MKQEITLKWKKQEEIFTRKIPRKKIKDVFKGLESGFGPDKDMEKIISLIPIAIDIRINYDKCNRLWFTTEAGIIGIKTENPIIWMILKEYCK